MEMDAFSCHDNNSRCYGFVQFSYFSHFCTEIMRKTGTFNCSRWLSAAEEGKEGFIALGAFKIYLNIIKKMAEFAIAMVLMFQERTED